MVYRTNDDRELLRLHSNSTIRLFDAATVWDDATFPFSGNRVNIAAGRIDYDYFNGGVNFANNARFDADDCVSMLWQIKHQVQVGVNVRPHFHWLQTSANEPNWLIAWKKIKNGNAYVKETDFSNHTLANKLENLYTYTSGNLVQITKIPEIDMSDMGISDCIQFAFFRDVANDSGLFAGAESAPAVELNWEFDVHVPIDGWGSEEEFVKISY
jgi:hypothetical protein